MIAFAVIAAWTPTLMWVVIAHINANSPIAVVVVGGLIAGLFSVVNTILNIRLIRIATANREQIEEVKTVTDKVAVRRGDLPEHIIRRRREDTE